MRQHEHQIRMAHAVLHLVYFAAVFVEGHGIYAAIGGILFVSGALVTMLGGE